MTKWEVSARGQQIAHSESPDHVIETAAEELDGQILRSVQVELAPLRSQFDFDLGGQLRLHPHFPGEPDDVWLLYEPSGNVLTLRSDGTYSNHPADANTDPQWMPLG